MNKQPKISLNDAVELVKAAIHHGTKRERQSAAADRVFRALCEGGLDSRATYVTYSPQPDWILTNWPIPSELWLVVTLYLYDKSEAVTWAFPANVSAPVGWPSLSLKVDGPLPPAVRLTKIQIAAHDVSRLCDEIASEGSVAENRKTSPSQKKIKRSASQVPDIVMALQQLYPTAPTPNRSAILAAVEGKLGREVSLRSLDRARKTAWPQP